MRASLKISKKRMKVQKSKKEEKEILMGDLCCPQRGQKDTAGNLKNETCMSRSRFPLSSCPDFPKPHDKHSP